jgi:hypothetical protein
MPYCAELNARRPILKKKKAPEESHPDASEAHEN